MIVRSIFFYYLFLLLVGCADSSERKVGTAFLPDGSSYKGELEKGIPHGKGKAKLADGSTYEGNWEDGFPEGKGKFVFGDDTKWKGDYFEGLSSKGKSNGPGVYYFANGSRYEGEFKDDLFHGEGSLVLNDGSMLKGNWDKGLMIDGDFPKDYVKPEWEPFSPDGTFRISFPSKDLQSSEVPQNTIAGMIPTKAWQLSFPPSENPLNFLYSFSYTDFDPGLLDANDPKQREQEIARYWKNIQRGEANVLINSALSEYPGREFVMDFVRDDAQARTKCFFVGQRFYKLLVITNNRYLYNLSNQYFFDSFEIL